MNIIYSQDIEKDLREVLISNQYKDFIFIADKNTWKDCYPLVSNTVPHAKSIVLEAGEETKSFSNVEFCLKILLDYKLDRNSCIIALGGGMICDLAGFVASIYKRGIDCIYIPTSLLCMVDACYGGKTGINFQFIKNIIGTFSNPKEILIYPEFLKTLPKNEYLSGFGEILKYGLIKNTPLWKMISGKHFNAFGNSIQEIIPICLEIKKDLVDLDPLENGIRKILNFGHTIGHAIESLALERGMSITHGEAVAYGIISENYLSKTKFGYSNVLYNEICKTIKMNYLPIHFSANDMNSLLNFMRHDKKNHLGEIRFVALQHPGKVLMDVSFHEEEIKDSLRYLLKFWDE